MKAINCPICSNELTIKMARGRKSNKPFIMLKCDVDGRHFRGFITDQNFIGKILSQNGEIPTSKPTGGVPGGVQEGSRQDTAIH